MFGRPLRNLATGRVSLVGGKYVAGYTEAPSALHLTQDLNATDLLTTTCSLGRNSRASSLEEVVVPEFASEADRHGKPSRQTNMRLAQAHTGRWLVGVSSPELASTSVNIKAGQDNGAHT